MEQLKKHKRDDVEAKKSALNITEEDNVAPETDVADIEEVADHLEKNKPAPKKHVKAKSSKSGRKAPEIQEKMRVAAFASVSAAERILNGLSNVYQSIFVAPPETKKNLNKEQAFKYFDKGDYERAKDSFLAYIEEGGNEEDANILYMIAMCHKNMEEYKDAIEYLKKADKLEKNDPNIITELGDCLLAIDEYPEAMVYLKKAAEIHPDQADILYHLGTCHEKTGQRDEAKKYYKQAIDLEPREAVYYQALGFVYETSGNHKDAIVCFKKAMDVEKVHKRGGGVKKNENIRHS